MPFSVHFLNLYVCILSRKLDLWWAAHSLFLTCEQVLFIRCGIEITNTKVSLHWVWGPLFAVCFDIFAPFPISNFVTIRSLLFYHDLQMPVLWFYFLPSVSILITLHCHFKKNFVPGFFHPHASLCTISMPGSQGSQTGTWYLTPLPPPTPTTQN